MTNTMVSNLAIGQRIKNYSNYTNWDAKDILIKFSNTEDTHFSEE
jgi:hypothetical protein